MKYTTDLSDLFEKLAALNERLSKISYTLDNIQLNYVKIDEKINAMEKEIQTINLKLVKLETNLSWIQRLKSPVLWTTGGLGGVSIIYAIIEYMTKK